MLETQNFASLFYFVRTALAETFGILPSCPDRELISLTSPSTMREMTAVGRSWKGSPWRASTMSECEEMTSLTSAAAPLSDNNTVMVPIRFSIRTSLGSGYYTKRCHAGIVYPNERAKVSFFCVFLQLQKNYCFLLKKRHAKIYKVLCINIVDECMLVSFGAEIGFGLSGTLL